MASLPFLHERPVYAMRQICGWRHLDRQALASSLSAVPAFSDPGSLEEQSTDGLFDIYNRSITDTIDSTLYDVELDVLSVSFSVRVVLTIGPRGYSSSVPCIGATGRKRANTGSTRSLPVRGTLDGFGPLSRISLVGLGPPAHRRLLSRLKHSSITTRPRSLPSARTRLNRRNQPSHLQHLALLSSPRLSTWTFVA